MKWQDRLLVRRFWFGLAQVALIGFVLGFLMPALISSSSTLLVILGLLSLPVLVTFLFLVNHQ